jgi:hypothetical protein
MGLCSSGDEYNWRAGAAFAAMTNTVRVVDDLLRFDRSFPAHVTGVCAILQAAHVAGITFSKEKFRFAKPRISWVGYDIQHCGVTIEEGKLIALSQILLFSFKSTPSSSTDWLSRRSADVVSSSDDHAALCKLVESTNAPTI